MTYDTRHNLVTTEPASGHVRGVALIAPAMATPARYYAPFATWLASHDVRAVVLEHRGSASRSDMKAYDGDLLDWFDDARDALDHVVRESPEPITWIGHSLGTQMLPFVDHEALTSVVSVASGTGWVGHLPGTMRWTAPVLMRSIGPLAMRVAGYYPGRTLRIMDDIPSGVMRQWSRWCLDRAYLGLDVPDAEDRFASVKTPMTVVSFTDDELMSLAATNDLHDRFVNADQTRQRYTPVQLEVDQMGHHGFFRSRHAGLWEELVLPYVARD
jgi:predicted alpha/beta hydrolase